MTYHVVKGGLPAQSTKLDERSLFTEAYAVLPGSTMTDIVASALPHWTKTRLWVIARPLSGFAETFSHYIMDVAPGGGSTRPDDDAKAEHVLFVVDGEPTITIDGNSHSLTGGSYVYLPPATDWSLVNEDERTAQFHWIRKRYEAVDGVETPEVFITSDTATKPAAMPDTDGKWATSRFVDPADLRHDMHVNIVTFQPGGVIPFLETHVMEHGLYVLEGEAAYRLNRDWVNVAAGDYMWLRAFCPQACEAKGTGPFRYLLYKDVNRHARLGSFVR